MKSAIILDAALWWVIAAVPVLGVRVSVWPITGIPSVIAERCLGAVVRMFDSDLATGWQLEEVAVVRGILIASPIVLEPPVAFVKLVEGINGCVCVLIVVRGVVGAVQAVHTLVPADCMGSCGDKESNKVEKVGACEMHVWNSMCYRTYYRYVTEFRDIIDLLEQGIKECREGL